MAPRTHFMLPALLLVLGLFTRYIAGQTTTTGTATSTSAPGRSEGLRVCFGKGSICVADNHLYDQCQEQREAHGSDGYYECVCTSGYAAVDEACDNCQLVYGMISSRLTNYTATCSSKDFTLAPIPSSVVAQQSSRNATLHAATGSPTVEPLTNAVTIKGSPTAPLPTVATTFTLPLATGAAARRLPQCWSLRGLVIVQILLGIRQ